MAKRIQTTSTDEMTEKPKVRVPRGKGTELPYGFGVEELKKGLNALAYSDGSADGFHKALNLRPPVMYYVSKALRTIGLLTDKFEKTPTGTSFVDSPSSHDKILAELILGYEPYMTIIKTCAVDPSLKSEAHLSWVAQKLASEIKTSQNPKQIARQAATSFGAFICAAGLGSMKTGKSGTIDWKVAPSQILQRSAAQTISKLESDIDETPSSVKPSVEMNIVQPNAQLSPPPSPAATPIYKKRQAVFSQEEINGGFSIGSSYLATAADMTNWTEAQIKSYWDGHNRGLELLLELLKSKVKP